MARRSVCLVSPSHLGSNPRLVKEADSLHDAGYVVSVIYGETFPGALERDASILADAGWEASAVSLLNSPFRFRIARLIHRFFLYLFRFGYKGSAAYSSHPIYPALRKAVLAEKADFYLGHCLSALPIVVAAAEKHKAKCGFDAEDFHPGESADEGWGKVRNAIAQKLESRYLRDCDLVTAASPLIAQQYEQLYQVEVTTLLNVFPLSEAVEPQPLPDIPTFYWFSQTIGAGRGIETFLNVLFEIEIEMRLDLRGHIDTTYRRYLEEQVSSSRVHLRFLPPAPPGEMVSLSAGYTAGLALEQKHPLNRNLCLTNKAFTYLLAGLPVILSDTRAQTRLAKDLGNAGLLVNFGQTGAAVEKLRAWIADEGQQRKARNEALRLGRECFCWDKEKESFLSEIEKVFSHDTELDPGSGSA